MADETDGFRTRTDRRSAFKKLGVGAAVAWTAPMIVTAPAPAASLSAPGCICGTNVVVNGDAETGALLPWTSYLNTPIGVESWSTLQAAGVEPPTGGGTYAFAILEDDIGDGYFDGGIHQQIDLGTGCGDLYHASASVSVASDLEAVGVPFLQRARVLVLLEIASFPYPSRSTTWETYLTPGSSSSKRTLDLTGFVFADVSSLEVRLEAFYSPDIGEMTGSVSVAFDNITLSIDCP